MCPYYKYVSNNNKSVCLIKSRLTSFHQNSWLLGLGITEGGNNLRPESWRICFFSTFLSWRSEISTLRSGEVWVQVTVLWCHQVLYLQIISGPALKSNPFSPLFTKKQNKTQDCRLLKWIIQLSYKENAIRGSKNTYKI